VQGREELPSRSLRLVVGLLLASSGVLRGCKDATTPDAAAKAELLLVPATEDAAAVVVDPARRTIVRSIGPRLTGQGPTFLNGGDLVTTGTTVAGEQVLLGFDAGTGTQLWRYVTATGNGQVLYDGTSLGTAAIAAHPSHHELFLWRSRRNAAFGVATFDTDRGAVTDFFGPLATRPGGLAYLPPNPRFPEGGLIVFGDDGPQQNLRAHLYVLTGSPMSLTDSLVFARPSSHVLQVSVADDGREMVVATDTRLLRVDVVAWRIAASAVRPNGGLVAHSPRDDRFFIVAPGTATQPSSDLIYVLQADLELLAVVDLRALPGGVRPLGVGGGVVSRDGQRYYVVTGIRSDGPLYGPEVTRLVVVSTGTLTLSDVMVLNTLGGGPPLLMP
jgi:hypothetical protein